MLNSRYNTIRFKLSLVVGLLTAFFSIILVSYFNYKYKRTIIQDAIENSAVHAEEYAMRIKSRIEVSLDISRTLSNILIEKKEQNGITAQSREEVSSMLKGVLKKNEELLGIYTAWEPNLFDGLDSMYAGKEGNHPKGSFVPYFAKDSKGNMIYEPLKYYLEEGRGDYYLIPRQSKQETVVDPIKYKIGDRDVMLMTLVVPIINTAGDFLGIVGTDVSTESIQSLTDKAELFEGKGSLAVISGKGIVVSYSGRPELVGKNLQEVNLPLTTKLEEVKNKTLSYTDNNLLTTIVPLYFGKSTTPWYIVISVPMADLTENLTWELVKLSLFSFVFLALLIFITSWFIIKLLKPLHKITGIANKLAVGNLEIWGVESSSNEIELLNNAFSKVIASQKQITDVCGAIASRDYSQRAIVKSEQDKLSQSVNQMIDFLKDSSIEDEKRKWSNEGYASFAEVLRNEQNLKKLTQSALNYLIKYLGANQGSIFISYEDQGTYLELTAAYAFDRVKYIQKRIHPGEGLTGQAYLEKDMILLTEIPKDYVHITSGLGTSTPRCICIVPLMNNEKVEGILELASFHVPEQYQIDFLQRCASNLASSIANFRTNDLTQKLFQEATEQTNQMKQQEEELRQNMEELSATQEEMRRREGKYLEEIEDLKRRVIKGEAA